jgi:hypothetical protein
VKVNDPAIFFRPIRGFGAPDRRWYTGALQSLSHPFVEDAGLDFAQRRSLRGLEKDGRDEGRRAVGRQVNKLGAEP